jgi:hypothetical protein
MARAREAEDGETHCCARSGAQRPAPVITGSGRFSVLPRLIAACIQRERFAANEPGCSGTLLYIPVSYAAVRGAPSPLPLAAGQVLPLKMGARGRQRWHGEGEGVGIVHQPRERLGIVF